MPRRIKDPFSNLPVSRQRKYQLRKKEDGLCTNCGSQESVTAYHCLDCAIKARDRQHKRLNCKRKYDCKTRRLQK
jgi:hypothetical protein